MDNRRRGVAFATVGAGLAVLSVLLLAVANDADGFSVGVWTGFPIVVSLVFLIMSLVFLSVSDSRRS